MSKVPDAISNAGPLIALAKLNRLDILSALFRRVQMPSPVYDEVVRRGVARGAPDAQPVRLFWHQQRWPIVDVEPALLQSLRPTAVLGSGELAVLALAMAANPRPLVLIDDASARSEALRLGLEMRGTLSLIVTAQRVGYLSLAQTDLLLQQIAMRPDIWISAQLCERVRAGLDSPSGTS